MAQPTDATRPTHPDADPSAPALPVRTDTSAAMERPMSHTVQDTAPTEGHPSNEYLLFSCGQTSCAVPLRDLREVLTTLPAVVPLPFSPPWLLGVFPLRSELVGLVDPASILLGSSAPSTEPAPPPNALVAGDDDKLIGLAVSSVGNIALVQPEAIVRDAPHATAGVALPYAAGHYISPPDGRAYAIVNMPRLVADVLQALTEAAAHE